MTAVDRPTVGARPRIDPRMARRVVEVGQAQGRRRLRALVAAGSVAAVLGLCAAVAESPLGAVRHVRVEGASGAAADAVVAAARIGSSTPMVHIGTGAAIARIEAVPAVASAAVVRQWPATVRLDVTLRHAVATATAPGGTVTIDASGRILAVGATAPDLPAVTLAGLAIPAPGGWLPGAEAHTTAPDRNGPVGRQLALAVALGRAGLPVPGPPVTCAEGQDGLQALVGTTRVVFGDDGDLPAEITALAAVEAATPLGAGGTLDVRVPARPTFVAPLTGQGATGSVSTQARG